MKSVNRVEVVVFGLPGWSGGGVATVTAGTRAVAWAVWLGVEAHGLYTV